MLVKLAKAVFAIALVALLPIVPYMFIGYSGHDYVFHASSWLELRNAWRTGYFGPVWASMANFNLGDPHLVLYPPISLLFGGFLSLLLPFRFVPGAFIWLVLSLAGLSMYVAAKPFVSERDRLRAALLYTLNPYLVITALVRFAAAELLVQAWLPLLLLCFYRAIASPPGPDHPQSRRAILLLGCLLGLTWLTNIPASLILLYGLAAVAAICCVDRRSAAPILRLLAAQGIAGALSAIYLLPLWFERAWINQAGLVRSEPRRLLIFMPATGPETLKTFKYSVWACAIVGVILILICLRKRSKRLSEDPAARIWLYLTLVSFFFQFPISVWLWYHLPELRAAEYPFRFLPIMGVVLPLLLFAPETLGGLRKPICSAVVLLSMSPLLQSLRVQTHASSRFPHIAALTRTWQTQGYAGLAEYWPAGISNRPTPATATPDCTVDPAAQSHNSLSFHVVARSACVIELPLLAYPYWHAFDDLGHPIAIKTNPRGLISLAMLPGNHHVQLTFQTATTARRLGVGISLATLLAIVATLALFDFGEVGDDRI